MSLYFALRRLGKVEIRWSIRCTKRSGIAPRLLNSEHTLRIHGASLWKVEAIHMSLPLFGLLGKTFGGREQIDV